MFFRLLSSLSLLSGRFHVPYTTESTFSCQIHPALQLLVAFFPIHEAPQTPMLCFFDPPSLLKKKKESGFKNSNRRPPKYLSSRIHSLPSFHLLHQSAINAHCKQRERRIQKSFAVEIDSIILVGDPRVARAYCSSFRSCSCFDASSS